MLTVRLVCVGKLKEKFYIEACKEYEKRLSAYCRFEIVEIPEQRTGDNPAEKEIALALNKEADLIDRMIIPGSYIIAMCIEGKLLSSVELAETIDRCAVNGVSRLTVIIGSSFGMSPRIKSRADLKLSMSPMTFPHHLARVMIAEQIYRSFKIAEGSGYHK